MFGEFAVVLHAGADDAELDRIEHAPAIGNAIEAMPLLARVQHPAFRIGGQLLGRRFVKRHLLAALRVLDLGRIPRREEPVLLRGEFLVHSRGGEPAGHGLVDGLLGERMAPGPSIMAAATSFEAISRYSGEVDACVQ